MPIFANEILHTGPRGLGVLRAAPAIGALTMSLVMARFPISRNAGKRLFVCVAIFGAATVIFGLSQNLWLSLAALAVSGAADMISVIIRGSLLQLATPPEMRGRVSAVNSLFIGASNELGEFESGLTAQWWGAVRATIIGGIGALAVAGLWAVLVSRLAQSRRTDFRGVATEAGKARESQRQATNEVSPLQQIDRLGEVGDANVLGQRRMLALEGQIHLPRDAPIAEVAGRRRSAVR